MKEDFTYKKRFGISTSIRYIPDVVINPKYEKAFNTYYKKFLKEHELLGSVIRRKRFDGLLKRIMHDGDDLHYCKRVEIRHISKTVGFGVFAKVNIPPYSILNHYAGLLTLDKEIDINNDSTFKFSDIKKYSLDAAKQGNWCRFMNHCRERDKRTNATAWEHYSEWGPRIIFTANHRGIKKGTQLLYSYGDEYWEEGQFEEF